MVTESESKHWTSTDMPEVESGYHFCASKHKFSQPASITPPNLKLSFGSSLGTHTLSLPDVLTTFPLLVGLKSANPCVLASAVRSLFYVFMQATCLSFNGPEPIC